MRFTTFAAMLTQLQDFILRDLWNQRLDELPKGKRILYKFLRVLTLAGRDFERDDCATKASSLTYFTLLSIVPILALLFGIAKGFGYEDQLKTKLFEYAVQYPELAEYLLEFANSTLSNAKGGVVAGIGIVVLLYSLIRLMSVIESAFNIVWQARKGRPVIRKITDYITIIFVAPILVILSSSTTVFFTTNVEKVIHSISFLAWMGNVTPFFFNLIPYFITWLLFTFLYWVMPNHKVQFGTALISGVIAGTFFEIMLWALLNLQILVSSYNAIYGSFAALPVLLVFIQMSWTIVLLGAEIGFAFQNIKGYEFQEESEKVSHEFRQKMALLLLRFIIENFKNDSETSADEIATRLGMPLRLVNDSIDMLIKAHLIVEVTLPDTEGSVLHPAIDYHKITVMYALKAIDRTGVSDLPIGANNAIEKLDQTMLELAQNFANSEQNLRLEDVEVDFNS